MSNIRSRQPQNASFYQASAQLPPNPFHKGRGQIEKTIRRGPICSALFLLILVPLVMVTMVRTSLDGDERKWKLRDTSGGHPRVDTKPGAYTGTLWKTEQTVAKKLLGETTFARCDVHSVMSADQKTIINDWIFLEERDAVNVAVYTKEGHFLLFQQRKYAIPGETLSPVGGFINNGESPLDAARREVKEELGVGSTHTLSIFTNGSGVVSSTESKEHPFGIPTGVAVLDEYGLADGKVPDDEPTWVFLGRYRTSANRGGGFLYSYLLMDAVPIVKGGGTSEYVRTGDDEAQKLVKLTKDQVSVAVANGDFKEIKWAATMSLSLLHLQKQELKQR